MGLFNFGNSYLKEGKGVSKDEPKRKGFFLFWDIIFQKIVKFIKLNSLYSLLSFVWFLFICSMTPINSDMIAAITSDPKEIAVLEVGIPLVFATLIFNLWGCAPLAAPYAYITRCYTRGEHAWLWSDGKDKFKENIKQSLVLMVLDIVVLYMGINALYFYYVNFNSTGEFVWQIMFGLLLLGLILYTVMHYYIYQMMVTFKGSLLQHMKNSMICAVGNLPFTVLHTAMSVAVTLSLFFSIMPQLVVILNFTVLLCITRYPMEFYATRVIDKLIKSQKKEAKITYINNEEE